MHQEATIPDTREFSASQMKRGLVLARGHERLRMDPDQAVSSLYSSRGHRLVLGREAVEVYKVQAGIVVPQRARDLRIKLSPEAIEVSSSEPVQATHTLKLLGGSSSTGFTRSVRFSNRSESAVRLRVVSLHDPTSMNFRRERDPPGEVGVNAFNRGDHVVMDDVGDTTGVRVISFSPRPSTVYMTKDRQKALDLLNSGELPDSVAGMSGAIIVMTEWEFDLAPGARTDLRVTSLYHPSSLEAALSDLGDWTSSLSRTERPAVPAVANFSSSVSSANFAFSWARAALDSIEGDDDRLDKLASGFGLQVMRSEWFERQFEEHKRSQRKDGLLAGAGSEAAASSPAVLETSLFILHAAGYALMKGDKKLAKKWYPTLRKGGLGLQSLVKSGPVSTPSSPPEGWRRRLGSGFPTGVVAEVNLVVCRALNDLAQMAYMVGKGSDSAAFTESKVRLLERVNSSLRDAESGALALNLDPQGRLHKELTVDQVIGLAYYPLDNNLSSSLVHRLLEADFETGFGPRTVPSSNALYYSPTYGDGQLGGYWTRAALAHALLAYSSGYPSIGSLQLEKVARLVLSESEKMGGVPGEYPYWIDPERKVVSSVGSDPVAAARFIEALLVGEAGLQRTPKGLRLSPPKGSKFKWLSLSDLNLGEKGSFFVGRAANQVFSASSYSRVSSEGAKAFPHSEALDTRSPVQALLFWDDSNILVCLGNTAPTDAAATVSIPAKGKPIDRSLFVDVEELHPDTTTWHRSERKRVLERVELRVDVKASSWKWLRVTQIT